MTQEQLKIEIGKLIEKQSPQKVLKALAEELANRESLIEERSNIELRLGVEYLLMAVMILVPGGKKKATALAKQLMASSYIKAAVKVINPENSGHSAAFKQAYKEYLEFIK